MTYAQAAHLFKLLALYGFAVLVGCLVLAIVIGHIRMTVWKWKNRRLVDRVSSRSMAEYYAGRRPWW